MNDDSSLPAKRKRGRPPRTFSSSGGTKITLRELGMTRKFVFDCLAIASLPEDVFEAELRKPKMPTTRGLVNLSKNRPPGYRAGSLLTEALRAALRLSGEDRHALCVAILNIDEAAEVYAALARVRSSTQPTAAIDIADWPNVP